MRRATRASLGRKTDTKRLPRSTVACLTRLPLRGIKKEKQTRAAFIGKRPERQKHKRERGREREKTLICIERPRSDTNVGVME